MRFPKSGITLKQILLFGTPVVVAGVAGLCCIYFHRRKSTAAAAAESPIAPQSRANVESTPQTPLDIAVALKNRGNKFFKAGRYQQAVECYTEALETCPEDSVTERATFYQNRAAALENLRQTQKAIEDCTAALELSPKYLKALSRRAQLYEKIGSLDLCLMDSTACCILERFQNSDNVLRVDRVLKRVGQEKAKEERPNLPRNLPSASFIKNYLSAFAWDPFTREAAMNDAKAPAADASAPTTTTTATAAATTTEEPVAGSDVAAATIDKPEEGDQKADSDTSDAVVVPPATESNNDEATIFELPKLLVQAYEALDKALELMESEQYEDSMAAAAKAVKYFTKAPKVELADFVKSSLGARERPIAAKSRALLIDATFKALSGFSEEAKTHFQAVGEEMYASRRVRVNALIKAACLSMTVDQDLSACLYTFQQAQTICPECPDVYLHRGQINLLAEQLDEALNDLNMAVKLQPDFSVALAQRLYTLYRRDVNAGKDSNTEIRLNEFRKLVEKYPNCLETHSLYAQVLTERGEYEKSDAEFARVIELAPSSGMAYAHRGLLQLRWRQDQASAIEWFRKGVEVDPKCELALELLGQLSMERGQFDEALNYFNQAIQQAKTLADLTHLISLREGVKAQMHVCSTYNISVSEMFASLQQEFQQQMANL
ncbi:Mitochondrial import receptor subunit TOM70 [Sparganum proliferum]